MLWIRFRSVLQCRRRALQAPFFLRWSPATKIGTYYHGRRWYDQPTVTVHPHSRRLWGWGGGTLVTLAECVRLRIVILIYSIIRLHRSRAPRRHLLSPSPPSSTRAHAHTTPAAAAVLVFHRATRVETPTHDHLSGLRRAASDGIESPPSIACRRFQLSPLPSMDSRRSHRRLPASPPLSRPARQSRVFWQPRRDATATTGCLPCVVSARFFFFPSKWVAESTCPSAHDPRVRISCFDQDFVLIHPLYE